MGLSRLTHGIQQGFMHGKRFLGQAYTDGKKFLSHLDNYAGIARNVIGAVAPAVGQLTGPVGFAVGAAVGAGARPFARPRGRLSLCGAHGHSHRKAQR